MMTTKKLLAIGAIVALAPCFALGAVLAWSPGVAPPGATTALEIEAQEEFDQRDWPFKDEVRQTVRLQPGATVEIGSINGTVRAETSDSNAAEIYIVRSARTKAELEYRKIDLTATPERLVIKGEQERGRQRGEVRHRVVLKLPRNIELSVSGVNGAVQIGAIDGMVHVNGINGRVAIDHAMSTTDISGINGRVQIALTRLDERGLTISGVNGKVELQFAEDLNADINVDGINGNVVSEVGNITIQGKVTPSSFRGRIGAGGPAIEVSGVNGSVRFVREGTAFEY
jgi:DUF4097 and DUF4098 domain-containing protein YvlB